MTIPLRFILASLALGATTLVRAESDAAPRATTRALHPLLAAIDVDQDGTLSAEEIAAASVALTALDLNEDGTISPPRSTSASRRSKSTDKN